MTELESGAQRIMLYLLFEPNLDVRILHNRDVLTGRTLALPSNIAHLESPNCKGIQTQCPSSRS